MVISLLPKAGMHLIAGVYKIKDDNETRLPYSKPDIYLGWNIKEFGNPESEEFVGWSISGDHYVENTINNVS